MKLDVKDFERKMQKSIDAYDNELKSIRAGRANPGVLDKITVDYYGSPTQIASVAQISVPDARTITITPWDKTTLKAIEKAIQASELGINPQNDGSMLRLSFPPLTEERRKELAKEISKKGEAAKVALRNMPRCQRQVQGTEEGRHHDRGRTEDLRKGSPGSDRQVHKAA